MERRDFFISYTKKDTEQAVWIAHVLMSHGYTVYIQQLDIKPGDNFLKKMNEFLKNSANFIAVWSEAYSNSRYCMTEMEAAFNEWHKRHINVFLPVRIENCQMEPLYAAMVHADLFGMNKAKAEKELIDAVRSVVSHVEKELDTPATPDKNELDTPTKSEQPENTNGVSLKSVVKSILFVMIIALICAAAVVFRDSIMNSVYELFEHNLSSAELYQMGYDYCYGENGKNVKYKKAWTYYKRAENKINEDSPIRELLYEIGYFYEKGNGVVEKNYTKARIYYGEAANEGSANALYRLGCLYHDGLGVTANLDRAMEYYTRAAEKGHPISQYILNWIWSYNEKARSYYEQGANEEEGNEFFLYNLGWMYEYGQGVDVNYAKAIEYYQQAADKGYDRAAEKVANLREVLLNG